MQRWPMDASEVPGFMTALLTFARECRSLRTAGGCGWIGGGRLDRPRVAAELEMAYLLTHFTRAMLYAIEETYLPAATAACTLQEVLQWTPDERDLVAGIEELLPLRGGEVLRRTGLPARDLSCFACLAHSGLEDEQCTRALQRPTMDCVRHILLWEVEKAAEDARRDAGETVDDPLFPPGPKALCEAVLSSA